MRSGPGLSSWVTAHGWKVNRELGSLPQRKQRRIRGRLVGETNISEMGGRSYRGDEWKEESQERGAVAALGRRAFPQVRVKGYRGVEKEGPGDSATFFTWNQDLLPFSFLG